MRLQIDEETAGIEGDVGSIDADEGGQARDIRVFENDRRQILLMFGHRRKGNGLGGLGHALYDAGVLDGEKPLRDRDIEIAGEDEGRKATMSVTI